jgi:glycosyltransferase involved in cell wall biosynthesis
MINTFKPLPKISIITPSYNQSKFIEATILSIFDQKYDNLEYIIIDGGSTDDTLQVIEKYSSRIDIVVSEKDNGQSDAINKGFALATGDIFCWLNSDDCFLPNTFNTISKYFLNYSSDYRMILYGKGKFLYDKYNFTINNNTSLLSNQYPIEFCDFLIQPSTFWGRTVWEEIGVLRTDLHYCFDWEWFIRAFKSNIPFHSIDEHLSIYRIHSNHKSSNAGTKRTYEIANFCCELHGEKISSVYLKLNKNKFLIVLRRTLRRIPKYLDFINLLYWKYFIKKTIPFNVYKLLLSTP